MYDSHVDPDRKREGGHVALNTPALTGGVRRRGPGGVAGGGRAEGGPSCRPCVRSCSSHDSRARFRWSSCSRHVGGGHEARVRLEGRPGRRNRRRGRGAGRTGRMRSLYRRVAPSKADPLPRDRRPPAARPFWPWALLLVFCSPPPTGVAGVLLEPAPVPAPRAGRGRARPPDRGLARQHPPPERRRSPAVVAVTYRAAGWAGLQVIYFVMLGNLLRGHAAAGRSPAWASRPAARSLFLVLFLAVHACFSARRLRLADGR